MNAKPMDPDAFEYVQSVMQSMGEIRIIDLVNDMCSLADQGRSALFAAKALTPESLARGVDVHILNLMEMARAALTGRFEELEENLDVCEQRVRSQIQQLVLERLALRKALAAVVGILGPSELDRISEAAQALAADGVADPADPESDLLPAFMAQLQRRGVDITWEKPSPNLPAQPVAHTKESAKRARTLRRLANQYVQKVLRADIKALMEA